MRVVEHINRERIVLLGWSRAILMQIAHPLVGAGVVEHSAFRGSPVQAALRLHHTVSAMLALTFGPREAHAAAIAGIRAIHRRVHGRLPHAAGPFPAGTPYSAEDPALLLWVHATLLDSNADVYQRVVGPLAEEALDALCIESIGVLVELGGDPAMAPRRWAALRAYIDDMLRSGTLAVTDDTRALGRAVLAPRAAGIAMPLGRLHTLLVVGLLPPGLREAYGFRWSPVRERRFQRALRALRVLRRLTPAALAHWHPARGARPDVGREPAR